MVPPPAPCPPPPRAQPPAMLTNRAAKRMNLNALAIFVFRLPAGRSVARLRELDALLGHSFENLQRDLFIERREGCSVRGTITVADRNQHGVIAKADPHRRWMRGIATFMVLQDARHERSKTANPFRWRIGPQP